MHTHTHTHVHTQSHAHTLSSPPRRENEKRRECAAARIITTCNSEQMNTFAPLSLSRSRDSASCIDVLSDVPSDLLLARLRVCTHIVHFYLIGPRVIVSRQFLRQFPSSSIFLAPGGWRGSCEGGAPLGLIHTKIELQTLNLFFFLVKEEL